MCLNDRVCCSVLGPFYNLPKFCPSTRWLEDPITFGDNSNFSRIHNIFISIDNTIYVSDQGTNRIYVWLNGSIDSMKILSGDFYYSNSFFVTQSENMYVDNGNVNGLIEKWTLNATSGISAMNIGYQTACHGIFIDISNTLYCSIRDKHIVVKRWLNDSVLTTTIVAGTGEYGSMANMLNYPRGIFVDADFDLYVTDCENNRIQRFHQGQFHGVTIVGDGAVLKSITLKCPTQVVFDANGDLFIVDILNDCIIRLMSKGFQCVSDCSTFIDKIGSGYYLLQSITFDTYGNIFVIDQGNRQIQKFIMINNILGKSLVFFLYTCLFVIPLLV